MKMQRTEKVHIFECSREELSSAESSSGGRNVEVPLGADFWKTICEYKNTVAAVMCKREGSFTDGP